MHKLSQRGVIQLIILLILVAGLIAGVYLVQRTQIFKPKASVSGPITPTTSFTLSSSKQQYSVGEEVAVQILVQSDVTLTNLFTAKINYNPESLRLGRVDTTASFIRNWVEQYWADPEKISLVGGVPSPGIQTQVEDNDLMATLYFTALKAGNTTISFDDTSAIYSNIDNTNILVGKNNADIRITVGQLTSPSPASAYNLPADYSTQANRGWYYYFKSANQNPAQAQFGSSLLNGPDWYQEAATYYHAGSSTSTMIAQRTWVADVGKYAVIYWKAPSAGSAQVTLTDQKLAGEVNRGDGYNLGIGYAATVGEWPNTFQQRETVANSKADQTTITISKDMQGNGDAIVFAKTAASSVEGDASRYTIQVSFTPSSGGASPSGETITYTIQADGWNSIGIPVNFSMPPAQFLSLTNGKCTEIQGFDPLAGQARAYFSDPEKAVLNSLTQVTGGKGYLIKCHNNPVTFSITGTPITAMPELVISNVQYIAVPRGYSKTGEQFLNEVSTTSRNCTSFDSFVAGSWETHSKGHVPNNFVMNDLEGYSVRCEAVSSVSPSPTPVATPVSGTGDGTGDGNGDGTINMVDLSVLLSDFRKTTGFRREIDLNGDGRINTFDFSLMRNLLIQRGVIKG